MPLLDHFAPPVDERISWAAFHANWATRLAEHITELLPDGFTAEETFYPSCEVAIDVATYEDADRAADPLRSDWQPPEPDHAAELAFPESHEVKVYRTTGGRTLVAAIELVSLSNKDWPAERLAFATKCAAYLFNGVSLIVVDVVTERPGNLHNEIVRRLTGQASGQIAGGVRLYAVAYRPVVREKVVELDVWTHPLTVGGLLPTLPLRLVGDYFLPVNLDETYQEACRRQRLV